MASRSVLPLIRRARAGDASSQFELGKLYLDGGQGLGANQQSALLWLDKAAEQGHAAAWRLIGQRVPPGVAQDVRYSRNLVRWYELASNDGCATAQTKLVQLFLSNRPASETSPPPEWAIQLLRRAATNGDATACLELGVCLLAHQTDGDANTVEALQFLEQAYAGGRHAAARHLGAHYWRTGDPERACLWYSRCADLQDAELCYRLGMLRSLLGEPVGDLLDRAAAARHPLACEELGIRYAIGCCHNAGGSLNSRNFKKAARWLERAAALGSAKSCFFLALLYDHQNCSFRSQSAAHEWLFEAARRGHAEAQYRAGVRLLRDPTCARAREAGEARLDDPDVLAIRLLMAAERQGHVQAASVLDAAACRGPRHDAVHAAQWANAVAAMAPLSMPIAMRLELARAFGLRIAEMIMIDPVQAYRGDCFVIDLRNTEVKLRRRIVMIEHSAQRLAADKAKELFRASPIAGDFDGGYKARYQQLIRRCARAGVDLHQLKRHPGRILLPAHAGTRFAAAETEAVPSTFPSRRTDAVRPIGRFAT